MDKVRDKYASSVDIKDFKSWLHRLVKSSERVAEIKNVMTKGTALFLYLLYKDMYNTTEGDIDAEFIRLLDDNHIRIADDGLIDNMQYLFEDVPIRDYILLIADSVVFLDVPTVDHMRSEYIAQLPNLKDIMISPTEELRRIPNIRKVYYQGSIPRTVREEVDVTIAEHE